MKSILMIFISLFLAACSGIEHHQPYIFKDKTPKTFVALFEGNIEQIGCETHTPLYIKGSIKNGIVNMSIDDKKNLVMKLSDTGSFEGEILINENKQGDEIQNYTGQILDKQIIVNATFGIRNNINLQCSGHGNMLLK